LLSRTAIAVVGAGIASSTGQRFARILASDLGAEGILVVSGLTRGIDAAAHEGALASGTAAVLAGGVDDVYPPEHKGLYEQIVARGLIVSQNPPGRRAQARDFPRRNRIISGLCRGTVVVEAELRSGFLITARLAAEQGRDVWTVPGSPLAPRSRGVNDLIRQGAMVCEGAADVLRELSTVRSLDEPDRFTSPVRTSMTQPSPRPRRGFMAPCCTTFPPFPCPSTNSSGPRGHPQRSCWPPSWNWRWQVGSNCILEVWSA
jgi:DNA processing protein